MPTRDTSQDDTRRVDRRAALGIWASGLMGLTSACAERGVTEINSSDGKILQLEKDDFLVLVSDFAGQYQPGDRLTVKVLLNNQSTRYATARVRTRLLGRGQQAVVEAEAVSLNVKPLDAAVTERSMLIPRDLAPGDYTLQVELPAWSFEGRQTGGGTLSTSVKIGA
jgi:DNA-directed RNA polymerase subunit K/omega